MLYRGQALNRDYNVAELVGFDGEDHDEEEILAAWQRLIDTGFAFQLQGWYGRTASSLIQSGQCNPPPS